jgi:hypothetical protein
MLDLRNCTDLEFSNAVARATQMPLDFIAPAIAWSADETIGDGEEDSEGRPTTWRFQRNRWAAGYQTQTDTGIMCVMLDSAWARDADEARELAIAITRRACLP